MKVKSPDKSKKKKSEKGQSRSQSEADDRRLVQTKAVTSVSPLGYTEINLICGLIGAASFISLPFSLQEAGLGLGIFLMILTAYITDYSSKLMIQSAIMTRSVGYVGVMEAAFGRTGKYITLAMKFMGSVSGAVAINITIADIGVNIVQFFAGHQVMNTGSFIESRTFIIIIINIVMLPLTMFKNVAAYSKVGAFSLFFKLLLLLFVLIRLVTFDVPETPDAYNFFNFQFAQAMGIYALAFGVQTNSLVVLEYMENPTEERATRVNLISMGIAVLLYLFMALVGYATFTGNIQGNLLQNYCHDDKLMIAGNFVYLVALILSFPYMVFAMRELILVVEPHQYEPLTSVGLLLSSLVIMVLGAAGSLVSDCLGIVLEVNGILLSVPMAFLLPPIAALVIQPTKVWSWDNLPTFLVILYGLFIFVSGIVVTTKEILEGVQCFHGQEPEYCLSSNSTL